MPVSALPSSGPVAAKWCSPGLIVIVAAVVVLLIVAIESIVALAITVLDGGAAFLVLASAGLAGGWLMHWLGMGNRAWCERLILGAALGIGALSLLTLALGWAGFLTRGVAFGLVALLGLAGIVRLGLDLQSTRPPPEQTPAQTGRWLWMVVCPFAVIAILCACLPPGILWKGEEARGYDVLEYHLAVPKEFWLSGCIGFLPHNVYSNFPLNSEMLSLLMMTLCGDAIEASYMAQITNVCLGALFAASAWLAGSAFSRRAGMISGILAATTPWTAYLSGIAYVEIGMLAMGAAGLAAILRSRQDRVPHGFSRGGFNSPSPGASTGGSTEGSCKDARSKSQPTEFASPPLKRWGTRERWAMLIGLLGGLSIGFKYTALPLIVVPLAVLLMAREHSCRGRLVGLLVFGLGTAVTISPWLLRNLINTHNPVFPLGYSVFGAKASTWDDALEARWQKAHGQEGIAEPHLSQAGRLFWRTIGDPRMGGIVLILAVVGAIRCRDRWTLALLIMLVWQIFIWMTATHQYARFAVVLLLPLVLLAGRPWEARASGRLSAVMGTVLLVGTMLNLYRLADLQYHHARVEVVDAGSGVQYLEVHGRTDLFTEGADPIGAINELDRQAKVMLVGEARSFYVLPPCEYATVFNHHPLADAVRRNPDAQAIVQWLRRRGTRYLLVNWDEIDRLRPTYGFYPEIDRELFERLVRAGLKIVDSFSAGAERPSYAILYEVSRP